MNLPGDAIQIYKAALESVQPSVCIRQFLALNDQQLKLGDSFYAISRFKNIYVIGAGKAASAMALATEEILGNNITDGVIAVKKGHGMPLQHIRQIEAGHPLPDENSITATSLILDLLSKTTEDDLVIVLLSGGGSSLLADIPAGCTLHDVQEVYTQLLNCGADIRESNTVRKHLSQVKGGGLASKCDGCTVGVFIISDVIGDDISVIASGPTVPDATTPDDALNVLKKYHLTDMIPGCITDYLRNKDLQNCKPRKGDRCFDKITNHIIANNASALAAAKTTAEELGYETQIVSAAIHGEAREAAAQWAAIAKKQKGKTCLLAGGETTVTIKGNGNGGRNQEFALAALAALQNEPGVVIASAGSDGTDGPTEVAGAIVSADTFLKASALNLDINAFLSGNDSYHFFETTGGHIVTGPTQTNVMDIIIALIDR